MQPAQEQEARQLSLREEVAVLAVALAESSQNALLRRCERWFPDSGWDVRVHTGASRQGTPCGCPQPTRRTSPAGSNVDTSLADFSGVF